MNKNKKRLIFCLTPTKNEEWVIRQFIQAASLWADRIVIADQQSSDDTVKIAKTFPSVTIINNNTSNLNEDSRQNLLINEARKYSGEKVLVSLDADEFFTPNFDCAEWNKIIKSPIGTSFFLSMYNVLPGLKKMWQFKKRFPLIYIDDNASFSGVTIHGNRLPVNASKTTLLNEVGVLHFQFYDWQRNLHKMRWYQAWEAINHPDRHPIDIFRQYHHYLSIHIIHKIIPKTWIDDYQKMGINFNKLKINGDYWWDKDIANWTSKYGRDYFKYFDIGQSNKDVNIKHWLLMRYLYLTQYLYPGFFIPRSDNFLKKVYV